MLADRYTTPRPRFVMPAETLLNVTYPFPIRPRRQPHVMPVRGKLPTPRPVLRRLPTSPWGRV